MRESSFSCVFGDPFTVAEGRRKKIDTIRSNLETATISCLLSGGTGQVFR